MMGHIYTPDVIHRLRVAERNRRDRANFGWSMVLVWGIVIILMLAAGSL